MGIGFTRLQLRLKGSGPQNFTRNTGTIASFAPMWREARRVHSVFDDPMSPSHCVSYWDRKQLEDKLAKDGAEDAKRPPRAPGQMSTADLDRLWMPAECSAEVEKAKDELGEIWGDP
jgi:hypothetical protein